MAAANLSLFSWDDVEELSDLSRLELVKQYLPDGEIVRKGTVYRTLSRAGDQPLETE